MRGRMDRNRMDHAEERAIGWNKEKQTTGERDADCMEKENQGYTRKEISKLNRRIAECMG